MITQLEKSIIDSINGLLEIANNITDIDLKKAFKKVIDGHISMLSEEAINENAIAKI